MEIAEEVAFLMGIVDLLGGGEFDLDVKYLFVLVEREVDGQVGKLVRTV